VKFANLIGHIRASEKIFGQILFVPPTLLSHTAMVQRSSGEWSGVIHLANI